MPDDAKKILDNMKSQLQKAEDGAADRTDELAQYAIQEHNWKVSVQDSMLGLMGQIAAVIEHIQKDKAEGTAIVERGKVLAAQFKDMREAMIKDHADK